MTLQEQQAQLAHYRLRQAAESLEEARYLLAGGLSTRSVVNRAYYAMFYSVLALLVFEQYASSKLFLPLAEEFISAVRENLAGRGLL